MNVQADTIAWLPAWHAHVLSLRKSAKGIRDYVGDSSLGIYVQAGSDEDSMWKFLSL